MTEVTHLPPGAVLVSAPQMLDGNFERTLVVMIQHDPGGAFGFVVNQKTELTTAGLVDGDSLLSKADLPLQDGGPVGRDRLQFLHRVPDQIPGGLRIVDGLYLGGDLEALGRDPEELAKLDQDLRLYLGYSGWGPGQLDAELEAGGWIPMESRPQVVFEAQGRQASWQLVMDYLGGSISGDGALGGGSDPDPSRN